MAIIKDVKTFEDVKVKIVTSFPDLLVYITKNKNQADGKDEVWYFETNTSTPDVKIKFVRNFEDLKIQYVNNISKAGWKNKNHRLINRLN